MDFRAERNAIRLLYRYFIKEQANVSEIPYVAQKTRVYQKGQPLLPSVLPERRGVRQEAICRLLHALDADPRIRIHTLSVMAGDRVICRVAAPGYRQEEWRLSYSLCKTLVGIAVGMLLDEGKLSLDTPVEQIFRGTHAHPGNVNGRMKQVTVRHLLTMTSGVVFHETATLTSADWVNAFLRSVTEFEPGKCFGYNSMNTYMLSAIVRQVSGEGLTEYLTSRLFRPLGMGDVLWECCPQGIEKGGWGLYLSPDAMLRLGRFLSAQEETEGVPLSMARKQELTNLWQEAGENNPYGYGYQIWVAKEGGYLLCNGMLGQNIWVDPQHGITVAVTGVNCEMFQDSPALRRITEIFSDAASYCKPSALAFPTRAFCRARKEFFLHRNDYLCTRTGVLGFFASRYEKERGTHLLAPYIGKRYRMEENRTTPFPLFTSFTQNYFGEGICAFALQKQRGNLWHFCFTGYGEAWDCIAGQECYRMGSLTFGGEVYRTAASFTVARGERGERVVKLELAFPEMPAVRHFRFTFTKEGLLIHGAELPGDDFFPALMESIGMILPKAKGIAGFFGRRFSDHSTADRVHEAFFPILHGTAEETAVTSDAVHIASDGDGTEADASSAPADTANDGEGAAESDAN